MVRQKIFLMLLFLRPSVIIYAQKTKSKVQFYNTTYGIQYGCNNPKFLIGYSISQKAF